MQDFSSKLEARHLPKVNGTHMGEPFRKKIAEIFTPETRKTLIRNE